MPNLNGKEYPYDQQGLRQYSIDSVNQDMGKSNGGPPMGGPPMAGPMGPPPMAGPGMGGQEQRLNQLLEARQMIDQEIAAIVGGPVGAENLDMLPPPPIDPMAQIPPEAMGAPNGMPMAGGPPMGQPMPPMGPQGLLGA